MAMAKVRSLGSALTGSSSHGQSTHSPRSEENIIKKGILKKGKNNKEQYFVLQYHHSKKATVILESYDTEQKFNDGGHPKKKYELKEGQYNVDHKQNHDNIYIITIKLNKDSIVFTTESKNDSHLWVHAFRKQKAYSNNTHQKYIEKEYEWDVEVADRDKARALHIFGACKIRYKNEVVTFEPKQNSNCNTKLNIPLCDILKCEHLGDNIVRVEFSHLPGVGPGVVFMHVEDSVIARNMADIFCNALECYKMSSECDASNQVQQSAVIGNRGTRTSSFSSGQFQASGEGIRRRCDSLPQTSEMAARRYIIDPPFEPSTIQQACSDSEESCLSANDAEEPTFTLDMTDSGSGEVTSPISPTTCLGGDSLSPFAHPFDSMDDSYRGYRGNSPRVGTPRAMPISPACSSNDGVYLKMEVTNNTMDVYLPMGCGDSTSSSCTSGTPSDENRMGDILGGSKGMPSSGSKVGEEDALDMLGLPIRTNSVGSKPDNLVFRKNSAPILGSSPISHSWSPSGSVLRDYHGNDRKGEMLELDPSKPKNLSRTSSEDKEKKRFFPNLRNKSSSKSQTRMRLSESGDSNRNSEVAKTGGTREATECCVIDFSGRVNDTATDASNGGYLQIHPTKHNGIYLDMTPRNVSSTSPTPANDTDVYVIMRQSDRIGPLPTYGEQKNRRSLNIVNPKSSLESISPTDLSINNSRESLPSDGESCKKLKKGSTRKSFNEKSSKRKQSDPGSHGSRSFEEGKRIISALASLGRKSNTSSTKSPSLPQSCSLPKGNRENASPFSSLSRLKNKESSLSPSPSFTPDAHSPDGIASEKTGKNLSLNFEHFAVPTIDLVDDRILPLSIEAKCVSPMEDEHKVMFSPLESNKRICDSPALADNVYVNIEVKKQQDMSPVLAQASHVDAISAHPLTSTTQDFHGYVNVCPTGSSLQILDIPKKPDCKFTCTSPKNPTNLSNPTKSLCGDDYVDISVASPPCKSSFSYESSTSSINCAQNSLQKLCLSESVSVPLNERCRSHSGPGGTQSPGLAGGGCKEERASSACSSPISHSPPTSPTLGSVSSMSSLSEGGMSSASSTCTVVNVGVGGRPPAPLVMPSSSGGPQVQQAQASPTSTAAKAASASQNKSSGQLCQPNTAVTGVHSSSISADNQQHSATNLPSPQKETTVVCATGSCSVATNTKDRNSNGERGASSSVSSSVNANGSCAAIDGASNSSSSLHVSTEASTIVSERETNYVCLEFDPKCKGSDVVSGPATSIASSEVESTPQLAGEVGEQSTYVAIDFTKSEGLRNTTIARDLIRH